MRIGLDVDGVLYQWDKTARYMLREILPGSTYSKYGPLGRTSTHWGYIQENVSKDDWSWLWKEGVAMGLFRYGHSFPGMVKDVRALAEKGDLVIITHRPQQAVNDTLDWLSYQKLPLSDVHLLTRQEPKSSVRPECDVYIDDKPENCADLARNTSGKVFMMSRDWNRHSPDIVGVTRVECLADFLGAI